eukprot:12882551-Alexandrium_andersonii.AAC.1
MPFAALHADSLVSSLTCPAPRGQLSARGRALRHAASFSRSLAMAKRRMACSTIRRLAPPGHLCEL